MVRRRGAGPEVVECGCEAGAQRAADAAVGELDGVAVAAADERGVDGDAADVVDEHRDRTLGAGQELVDDGGLAGAEVAAEQRHRYTAPIPRRRLGIVVHQDIHDGSHGSADRPGVPAPKTAALTTRSRRRSDGAGVLAPKTAALTTRFRRRAE